MDCRAPITMTPHEFIQKWKPVALTERAAAQEHFLDLCRLFGHQTPAEADPRGEVFAFEKGASKTGGGDGFADVWKQHFFAWEYKKKKRDLGAALEQLTRYASALDNPPLHVVCDTVRFRIETRWTNTVTAKYEFELEQLADPEKFAWLRAVFHDPEFLRPKQTRASLTRDAADKFQTISDRLQHRNPDKEAVAHFVNQLVFCFFANSVKLLPEGLLRKLIEISLKRPSKAKQYFDKLFAEMEKGGEFDLTEIKHFNGGLFDGRRALALEPDELGLLLALHSFRWDLIDPTIFGTLFERFLDPDKRAQIGAHYTDPDKIMQIVEPVVMRPLRREWEVAKGEIEAIMRPVLAEGGRGVEKRFEAARTKAEARRDTFVDRLCSLSILDPACGSGNFLYLALQAVKDLEYKALLECEALMLRRALPRVSPRILHGIEINPLAAELARSVIWIGDIQWGIANGLTHRPEPILEKLDSIECRDALVDWTQEPPIEALWPAAEFIVGNPPFLGAKLMKRRLGSEKTEVYRSIFADRLSGFSDFVCFWFAKSADAVKRSPKTRIGLVATDSIAGGTNRPILDRIRDNALIFDAWTSEPWVVDGARVRVALISFTGRSASDDLIRLNGEAVTSINPDLSAGLDFTKAARILENSNTSLLGVQKSGPHDIGGKLARQLITEPLNPNGRPNSEIIVPYWNGDDLTGRPRDVWLIDYPLDLSEVSASMFESPFQFLKNSQYDPDNQADTRSLVEARSKARDRHARVRWWEPYWARPELRSKLSQIQTYIATAETAEQGCFIFLDSRIIPDKNLIVICKNDHETFGILSSAFHRAWSLRLGTRLEDRPRYTTTTTFETFPFPEGLTPNLPASAYAGDPRAIRIAAAAKALDENRRAWLNPPDLVKIVPEVVPTAAPGEKPRRYPDRILPKNAEAAVKLKERTLTNLYNRRPDWLAALHEALDRAVAAAYGWPEDIPIDEALARLLALNLERAAAGR